MYAAFDRFVQSELTRLRTIERILHQPSIRWEIEVAGLRVPMVICSWHDTLQLSADFPALSPLAQQPVAYLVADGDPVYSVPLPSEIHSGQEFQVLVTWTVVEWSRDAS